MGRYSGRISLYALAFFCFLLCTPWCEVPCGAADTEKIYRLGHEDVVMITITAGGEQQVKTNMVVGDRGNVNVPFVGKVKAKGLTIDELEKDIVAPLEAEFFVDPQVHLQVAEYHSLHFFISGAVKNPGIFKLDFTPTIMDLVASAGGVIPERGNLAYVLRGDSIDKSRVGGGGDGVAKKEPIKVDLLKLLDKGDMSENIKLRSGDTVYIPLGTKLNQTTTKVYVQGKVKQPGMFDFQPGLTALGACIMAGGFDKFAAPGRTIIIRKTEKGQETIKIDLKSVQTGKFPDFTLEPGDRVHVPESWL